MNLEEIHIGQHVLWYYQLRHGYWKPFPAQVHKVGRHKITILLPTVTGGFLKRCVNPENLQPDPQFAPRGEVAYTLHMHYRHPLAEDIRTNEGWTVRPLDTITPSPSAWELQSCTPIYERLRLSDLTGAKTADDQVDHEAWTQWLLDTANWVEGLTDEEYQIALQRRGTLAPVPDRWELVARWRKLAYDGAAARAFALEFQEWRDARKHRGQQRN